MGAPQEPVGCEGQDCVKEALAAMHFSVAFRAQRNQVFF